MCCYNKHCKDGSNSVCVASQLCKDESNSVCVASQRVRVRTCCNSKLCKDVSKSVCVAIVNSARMEVTLYVLLCTLQGWK